MSRLIHTGLLTFVVLASTAWARPAARPADQPTEAELAMQRALEQTISVTLIDVPLSDIADYLEAASGIEIMLHEKGLLESGLSVREPVTLDVSGVRVSTALWMILSPWKCTFVPRDEVLLITSREVASEMVFTRTYDVADLVQSSRYDRPDFESLIEVITTLIEPSNWDEVGGPGSILEYSGDGLQCLVISQTAEVHGAIASLLDSLRDTRAGRSRPARSARFSARSDTRHARRALAPAARQRTYATTATWALPRTHE